MSVGQRLRVSAATFLKRRQWSRVAKEPVVLRSVNAKVKNLSSNEKRPSFKSFACSTFQKVHSCRDLALCDITKVASLALVEAWLS